MSTLRKEIIKLAYTQPALREHLLPLVKEASEDWLEKRVKNPDTGNEVKVKTLQSKPKDSKAYKMYQQLAEQQKKKFDSMSKGDIKKVFEDSSDKYFKQHVVKGFSKKKMTEAMKGTGWTPRGKGTYDKKRGLLSVLVDHEKHRPMWVSLSEGHYTKGDGEGNLVFENLPGGGSHADTMRLSGDAEKDTKEMLKLLKENLEYINDLPK